MARTPWKGTIGRRVPGSGPTTARVVLLAEAPGADEEDAGKPLVGRAGEFLFEGARGVPSHIWPGLERLGLDRASVRIENVLEVRPLGNDLDTVSLESMAKAQGDCWRRLEALPAIDLLVPLGNVALNTVLRSPLKRRKKRGTNAREWTWARTISSWRGSVNPLRIGTRDVTMIPTFHPAKFLYGGEGFQAWRADWARIAEAAASGIRVSPVLDHLVGPTLRQVELFERLVQHTWHREGKNALLALDIETVGAVIDCIGFCVDGETAMTIPLLPQLWPGGRHDVRRAWGVVERLVTHPIPKGTWWGYYDVFRLERQKGWKVRRWWWDGYDLHHLLDPTDSHGLDYGASRDLAVPYWKHLSKQEKKGPDRETKRDWRVRHDYNCRDVGATWWLIRKYQERLRGRWEATWQMIA